MAVVSDTQKFLAAFQRGRDLCRELDHPHVPDRRDTAVPFVAGNYDIEEGPVRPSAAEHLIRELEPNQIVTSDLR